MTDITELKLAIERATKSNFTDDDEKTFQSGHRIHDALYESMQKEINNNNISIEDAIISLSVSLAVIIRELSHTTLQAITFLISLTEIMLDIVAKEKDKEKD